MPSKSQRTATHNDALQLLRGGKAIPKDIVNRCVADLQQRRQQGIAKRIGTEKKMAQHLDRATGSLPPKDAGERQTSIDALRALHAKLAKEKILPPRIRGGLGGILPGQITVTVVPPFDYQVIIPTRLAGPDATLDGSADKNTGQMSGSAITSTARGFGGGSMYTTLGVYFHPLGSGRLTLSATPRFSFQWWTNSLSDSRLVRSFGSGGLTIYGVDVASQTTGGVGSIVATATTRFKTWDESQAGQVHFDFGFDIDVPACELGSEAGILAAFTDGERQLVGADDDFDAAGGFVDFVGLDFGGGEGVGDKGADIGVPLDDIDLLVIEFADDVFDALPP